MDSKELRIGNAIQRRGKLLLITAIAPPIITASHEGLKSDYLITDDQLHFIPLSAGILESCGFNKVGTPENPMRGIVYGIEDEDGTYEFKGAKVKYLHQLQNLYFALTGEELEVKL